MKITIDRAIPFIKGVFEPYAQVQYLEGSEIGPENIKDSDVLVTRTRTRCNAALLGGSAVKMIATATIGTDHIDLGWCKSHGIHIQNSAGCNAGGVMNYVLSAIYGVASRKRIDLRGCTAGIIGAGNVGSRVAAALGTLGMKVLLCDPPRAEAEGPRQFCDLDYLLRNSDIVTMHVPLNDGTRRMANAGFFSKMKLGAFFINAARGEVMDEAALIDSRTKLGAIIIDTWNGEPDVNRDLLAVTDIATPHIAGYSYQGKMTGTSMAVRAVARFMSIKELFDFFPKGDGALRDVVKLELQGKDQGQTASIIQYNYPIFTDDFMFRIEPEAFERLRENYSYRREFYIY